MPFINPIVFWTGLAAVGIPIVIHLLNRRRYRMLDWAAMQFLLESVKRNRRRLRIEELILLALRCMVLVVLGTALARLTGCAAMNALPGGSESQMAVFVLDDSYSMGQRVGGGTLFSAAAHDAAGQIAKLTDTDKLAIVLTGAGADDEPFFKPTHMANAERDVLANRLAGLKTTDGRANLEKALASAARVFADDKSVNRRLYIYGDFRQVDLADSAGGEAIRKACDELRKLGVDIVAMDFGRKAVSNLTVESLALADRFAVAKVPMRIRLEVRNNGENMVRDVQVKLGARLTTPDGLRDVELPPVVIEAIDRRSVARVEFTVTAPVGGPAVVSATLPPDELDADNKACLALNVRQAVRVLAVDGRLDMADPTSSESFFFAAALDPDRNGSEGTKVDVISPPALADTNLDEYDLVAMLNVGDLPVAMDANGHAVWPAVAACQQYVRDGGGLVIFTGDRVNPAFYNGPMFAEGSGLSPLRIAQRKGDPDRRKEFFRIDPRSIAGEAVTKVFQDFLAAGLDPTQFIRFYAFTAAGGVAPPPAGADIKPPRVLARFTDQDASPAIVARQFGRGSVLMFYTTATVAWNDWPADENGTFVAMLNDVVRYLAGSRAGSLTARVGEPIVYEIPPALKDASALLKTPLSPAQPAVALTAAPAGAASGGAATAPTGAAPGAAARPMELRYDRADTAGTYTLELALPDQTARQVLFARQVDPVEGDLTPGREPAVSAAIGTERLTYVDKQAPEAAQVAKADDRKEYWMWALALLAVLLAAETYLAQRFGHWPGGKKEKEEDLAQRAQRAQR
jgi:hypothetical protein